MRLLFIPRRLLSNINILCLILYSHSTFAQQYDHTWFFPEFAGIHFDANGMPLSIPSPIGGPHTAGKNACISDYGGNMIFYVDCPDYYLNNTFVYNAQGQVMQNGDSLNGNSSAYNGCTIFPTPQDSNLYYMFTNNRGFRPSTQGNVIHLSMVDPFYNNNSGRVLFRDSMIIADGVNEKSAMVHHANGRDWWLILQSATIDSLYYKILIDPSGFHVHTQKIGTGDNLNKFFGSMTFSNDGTKLVTCSWTCRLEVFDFDRCTGDLSNWINLSQPFCNFGPDEYQGCSISPSNRFVYATTADVQKYCYKFDLTATNPRASRQIIKNYPDTGIYFQGEMGQMAMGPDNVIYIANYFRQITTRYLDAILYPDSDCTNCNYVQDYFYLNYGNPLVNLPQFPNFRVGREAGSACDSIFNDVEFLTQKQSFKVFPNPTNDRLQINFDFSGNVSISLTDQLNRILKTSTIHSSEQLDISDLPAGLYYLYISYGKGRDCLKVVKL